MSIGIYTFSWRTLAASVATAAIFSMVAATAWGVTPQTWTTGDIVQLAEPGETINSVALSPDGKTLAVSFCNEKTGKGRVVFVDTATKKVVKTLTLPEGSGCVSSLQYSPDGKKLIGAGSQGRKIFEWDQEGTYIGASPAPDGNTASIDVNPVGGGSPVTPTPSTSRSSAPTPPPPPAIAMDGRNGQVDLRDSSGQPVPGSPVQTPFTHGISSIKDMEFSEDGKTVIAVGDDGRTGGACVLTWDGKQKQWVCNTKTGYTSMPSKPNDLDTSPTNPKEYAVGCFYGQAVIVIGGKKTVYKGHGDGAVCVEYLPNGNLAAGGWNGKIIIRDSKTKKVIAEIELGNKQIMHMVTSPDGLTIYVFDSDGKMTVIKQEPVPTGTPAQTPPKAEAPPASKSESSTAPPKTSSSYSPPQDPSMVQVNSWPY